jgi:hypothetical protein
VTQPSMPPPSDPTPGFDPDSQGGMRLWDGQGWTEVTRPMPQPATPAAGQPGYYPDSQGVMRWWTGRDWAPHPQPPGTGQPEPKKGNWIQRNIGWKLGVLIAILGLASCGAILNGFSSPPHQTTQSTAETSPIGDEEAPKSTEPEPKKTTKPEPKAEPAQRVTKREWAKVVKNPDSYIGERYIIYGQVTQFDSATGDDGFLADTAHANTMSYGFFDGENTVFTGTAKQLDDLVEDDVFRASVEVLGSYDYETQIGGETSAPAPGAQHQGHQLTVAETRVSQPRFVAIRMR